MNRRVLKFSLLPACFCPACPDGKWVPLIEDGISPGADGVAFALGRSGFEEFAQRANRFFRLCRIDADKGFGWEKICEIGAADVNRKRPAQIRIGNFLTPVIPMLTVFESQMKSIGQDGFEFIGDRLEATTKMNNLVTQLSFGLFQKVQP